MYERERERERKRERERERERKYQGRKVIGTKTESIKEEVLI